MPPIEKPPVSPQVQAQMGAPGGPNFGPGIGQAQQQMDKSPVEVAVSTVEKILMGIQDEKFKPYAMKAMATLKVGAAMAQQQGPQSSPMGTPPGGPQAGPGGGGPQQAPLPPMPGQMPG
jgi:hypothetical protein